MALAMSFETVPLRGDGINFFGPRIYDQNVEVDLSSFNFADDIIKTNQVCTGILGIGSVLAISENANARMLSRSVRKLKG